MKLSVEAFADQNRRWPATGHQILAQFDEETIVVYQAYSEAIGRFAIQHGHFGGEFKYSRMSWVKPNFLWMMYRSNWGQSQGQEVVLGIRLRRTFFDSLLEQAVPSTFSPDRFREHAAWKEAVAQSDVRLQWDPDHLPTGDKCERRAIQLGLRGDALSAYGRSEIVEIIDMSPFVAKQRPLALKWETGELFTPTEHVYIPASQKAAMNVGLESA
ncbi:DUF4291 domain-containing protein [Planctomicrobium piriforme]|uniref:DUF4291 domain-containing protein n=1 Tax=Planctomicrobium piriforme TaxID=1576369 RepID=A0A1I3B8B6_9PLAN|nr:DUF4291 domain-containing protein [Planctomicrobium piriforme]SFH58518.1 protein of unknown function [Planctomicrobium piriforme]